VATVLWLSRQPGFAMHTIWLVSVAAVTLQFCVCAALIRRELGLRAPLPMAAPAMPAV
jgi:hypothetical protein